MKSSTRGRMLAIALMGLVCFSAAPAMAQGTPEVDPAEIEKAEQLRRDMRQMMKLARDRVFPALVNIHVITVGYWGGKEHKGRAVGSGTIISPEGHVLTNFHVAQNGKKFKCTLSDNLEISATLVGEDPLTDLAVLKLDLSELPPGAKLPVAQFGDSDKLEIGDTVMAMGSPWALSRSVTRGSVSNTERILAGEDDEAGELQFDRDQRTGIFNRWIQHDAPISPGNSGGPLVNLEGEVIGVNTRGTSMGGDMAFAIPSNVARAVAGELVKNGEVARSWYGFSVKPIKKTGLKEGVLVDSVVGDSPAAKAGLQVGDVIVKVDDEPRTVWYPEQIPPFLKDMADRPIGSQTRFAIQRGDESKVITITSEKMERDKGDETAFRGWGVTGQEITDRMARNRRLDNKDGVLVTSVASGSPAQTAEPSIDEGDVIRSIDGKPVKSLDDFVAAYRSIMDAEKTPEFVLIEFDRNGKSQVTLIKPKPDKDDDPPREVPKAWIGVATQPLLDKLAKQMGYDNVLGFRVTRVYPGTLAAESDLRVGDIIVAINSEKLRPRGMQDAGMFQRVVRNLNIGDDAKLAVLRDKQAMDLTVKLDRARLTPEEAIRDVNRDFELTVRELTFFDRDENRWSEDIKGVVVVNPEPAGWAALAGLRPGDLIQRIDDAEITGMKSYRAAMEKIAAEQPERVVFVVLRGPRTYFNYAEPDWKPHTEKEEQASTKPGKDGE